MRDAVALAATYGVVPQYNEQYAESTFTYQKVYNGTTAGGLATSCTATRTAWYQDARAYSLRATLVDKYRLGGMAAWTLGMEEPLAIEGIRNVAKSIAPDQVTASLTTSASAIEYGDPITVSGSFTIKDKSPLANVLVRIEGKSPGDVNWRLLTSATTDMSGKISKPLLIGKATTIRAFTEGTWERNEGVSNEISLTVARLIITNPVTSAKQGESFTVTGSLRPRTVGTFITAEKLVNGKWVTLGTTVPTDSTGGFVIQVAPQRRGILVLRVTAAAEALYPVVATPQFSILVRGRTTPGLEK
jgi:hypothetical protein